MQAGNSFWKTPSASVEDTTALDCRAATEFRLALGVWASLSTELGGMAFIALDGKRPSFRHRSTYPAICPGALGWGCLPANTRKNDEKERDFSLAEKGIRGVVKETIVQRFTNSEKKKTSLFKFLTMQGAGLRFRVRSLFCADQAFLWIVICAIAEWQARPYSWMNMSLARIMRVSQS